MEVALTQELKHIAIFSISDTKLHSIAICNTAVVIYLICKHKYEGCMSTKAKGLRANADISGKSWLYIAIVTILVTVLQLNTIHTVIVSIVSKD